MHAQHLPDDLAHMLTICQIDEDFEMVFGTSAAQFTAKWEMLASKCLQQIKLDCKDDSALRILAELQNPRLTAGVDLDEDSEYTPSQGQCFVL